MKKGLVFDIKRFAVHDGDGIRTTVFLKGCPLHCVWCHNPEGISTSPQLAYYANKCIGCGECVSACVHQAQEIVNGHHVYRPEKCVDCANCVEGCLGEALKQYGTYRTAEELMPDILEDVDFYRNSGGGVTISGGECLMQPEFCTELLKLLKERQIHTAVDTCGFVSWKAIEQVLPYTDLFLYDIKAIDENVHIRCTGQSNRIILQNLKQLDEAGGKIEIRFPYVPGYNDGQMEKAADFMAGLKNLTKVRILPYHNYAGSKYDALNLPDTLPQRIPTDKEIQAAVELVKKKVKVPVI